MDPVNSLVRNISPAIHQELKTALELGKWQSEKTLDAEQKEIALQLVIAYETLYLKEEDRSGFVHQTKHQACDTFSVEDQVVELQNAKK